eukprot:360831-Chlamydomonas_euryale.AAC.1
MSPPCPHHRSRTYDSGLHAHANPLHTCPSLRPFLLRLRHCVCMAPRPHTSTLHTPASNRPRQAPRLRRRRCPAAAPLEVPGTRETARALPRAARCGTATAAVACAALPERRVCVYECGCRVGSTTDVYACWWGGPVV